MSSASTPLDGSEEGRSFLQHRVAVAGLFGACLGFVFVLNRMSGEFRSEIAHPSFWYHVGGASSMTVMWLVCRTGKRSIRVIRNVESFGILAAAVAYSFMGLYMRTWQMPHFIVLLALQGMFVARAIYVPSSARRTLLLTLAGGVPLLVSVFFIYRDVDLSKWTHIAPELRLASGPEVARNLVVFSALWWLVCIALCTAASMVIYGLRKTVRDARKLGQYELTEKLGEGGMGIVFRAEHAMLRRPTAVKLLPLDKAGERSIKRFEKEVRQTARLTHPNTVTIFDYGRTPDGVFYYAMELLDGATLRDIVELDGAQSPARVVRIIEQTARALAEAHDVGLVHRDIKPANIMLVRQGGELDVAKVLDFGLVKEVDQQTDLELTQADSITGTPQYLSPEAITDPDSVDGRSDLYALGAVAYFLLTGKHVFTGRTVVEVCSKHLHTDPEPFERDSGVPEDLAGLVMRCLAKEADERPQSAVEFARALRACDVVQWTQEDAAVWWKRCGAKVEGRVLANAEKATGLTLEIDMARRTPGSTPVDPSGETTVR